LYNLVKENPIKEKSKLKKKKRKIGPHTLGIVGKPI
jgi:hypothetical protein